MGVYVISSYMVSHGDPVFLTDMSGCSYQFQSEYNVLFDRKESQSAHFFLIIQGRGRHGARAKTKIKPERGLYHLSSRRSLLHILFVHFFCYFVLHHCFLWFLVHLLFMNIFKCNFYNRIERCNGLFLMSNCVVKILCLDTFVIKLIKKIYKKLDLADVSVHYLTTCSLTHFTLTTHHDISLVYSRQLRGATTLKKKNN